jgi:hypothetical protein
MAHDLDGSASEKLLRVLDAESVGDLTPEEIARLREMIVAWRGLTAFGWLVGAVRRWLWLIGLIVGLYWAWRGRPELIGSLMPGPPR